MYQRPNLDGMNSAEYNLLLEALDTLLEDTQERLDRLYGMDFPKAGRIEHFEAKLVKINEMIGRVGNDAEDSP